MSDPKTIQELFSGSVSDKRLVGQADLIYTILGISPLHIAQIPELM